MLDRFAQLKANVSVLSMFKVGLAKLDVLLRSVKCIFYKDVFVVFILFMAVLGLCCCIWAFCCSEWGGHTAVGCAGSLLLHLGLLLQRVRGPHCSWLCWVFVAASGPLLQRVRGPHCSCSVQASHCSGFFCCRAQALGTQASIVAARGFSSCGPWA